MAHPLPAWYALQEDDCGNTTQVIFVWEDDNVPLLSPVEDDYTARLQNFGRGSVSIRSVSLGLTTRSLHD